MEKCCNHRMFSDRCKIIKCNWMSIYVFSNRVYLTVAYVCLLWATVYFVPKPVPVGRIFFCWRSLCEVLGVMTDLWLISVPLDKTSSTSVEKLKRTIAKTKLATCCKFSIPELKVRLCDICPGEEPEGATQSMHSKHTLKVQV